MQYKINKYLLRVTFVVLAVALQGCATDMPKMPDVSMPDISIPDVSLPEISMPSLSLPDNLVPDVSIPGVHKIDVHQGNILSQEQVNQLKPGMSKQQVSYLLGSPMVTDTFHQERWDYIYSFQAGGQERVQKRLSLFFKGDQLSRLVGDYQPGGK